MYHIFNTCLFCQYRFTGKYLISAVLQVWLGLAAYKTSKGNDCSRKHPATQCVPVSELLYQKSLLKSGWRPATSDTLRPHLFATWLKTRTKTENTSRLCLNTPNTAQVKCTHQTCFHLFLFRTFFWLFAIVEYYTASYTRLKHCKIHLKSDK